MFPKFFDRHDLPLSEFEIEERRKKHRRILIVAVALLLLLVTGYFGARPAVNTIHGWQARRHARKAYVYIDQEKWSDARTEAIAAYQLRSTEPEAIRALARLLSRAGQADALSFWKQLSEHTKLTRDDLRDEAAVALKAQEFDVAEHAIKELLGPRDGGPVPSDSLLSAGLALQKQDFDGATATVRQIFGSDKTSDQNRFQATILLANILRARNAPDQSEVFEHLVQLARGSNDISLDALVALAQACLSLKSDWPNPGGMSIEDLIHALETHPLGKTQHRLLAVDLKIRQHPDQRDDIARNAISQFKNGDNTVLDGLGAWLNAHGEYQLELDTIPRDRALQTRELFFQHVDALGALGRWDDIRRLIESEKFPLDPVIEHMYLARCFAQQDQAAGADNNWQRALQAAAGDPAKLITLADYAEKNGALEVAAGAFDAAVAAAPQLRIAQQGRLRIAYAQRDTKKVHTILAELLKNWPNDAAVQNDEAYIRLLLTGSQQSQGESRNEKVEKDQRSESNDKEPITDNGELAAIEKTARELVKRNPHSLPHRTLLALALLKQNRPGDALAVYQDITIAPGALTQSALAVHAAVLAANGRTDDARTEISRLDTNSLLPQERALVGPTAL